MTRVLNRKNRLFLFCRPNGMTIEYGTGGVGSTPRPLAGKPKRPAHMHNINYHTAIPAAFIKHFLTSAWAVVFSSATTESYSGFVQIAPVVIPNSLTANGSFIALGGVA